MDAAATSIERDGIACTSKLEQTLFDDMNGLCRELMAALLAAGAATAKGYDPEPEERNAGNHGKRTVTLFGELPEIRRTYYWNEDSRKGHYPFDDRLGLIGRYTPAAADETIRYAVDHPYKDAAEAFSRNHAFKVSADTIREIVGLHRDRSSAFAKGIEILDVYHAVEHIKPLMLGLGIKEGSKEWNYRHRHWSECIRNGKVQNVLDYLWNKMRDRLKGDAMREYKYFRSNVGRMKYDEYRANGWFIGSGVIESACKTVIGQRFKQSGMIWSLKGAKALIPLRTLHKSNRLEEFFQHLVKDLRQVDCAA